MKSGHSGVFVDIAVSSTGGEQRAVTVYVDDPAYINGLRKGNQLPPLDQPALATGAQLAAIRAVDANSDFFASAESIQLQLGYADFDETPSTGRVTDQALRRYVARRLYLTWEHQSLDEYITFSEMDASLTGAGSDAFLRNLQLLEQEGYVQLSRTMGAGFSSFRARATAKLIRDVERYAAPAADVESEADYVARLEGHSSLSLDRDSILAERRRYEAARSAEEVASVFRATVPVLEGVVRRLLRAHGSKKDYSSLGPMIADLRSRSIGGLSLWSQLNAVLTNGRDISLHGERLPLPVLRMVTESCFELLPQLGALFPNPSSSTGG
ncbi:MAG: hypothetical protein HY704_17505 [Gemmatimonadetes bacterium]|nr:hypothetical protein [Gemmatimonadota bacterium]